MSGIIAVRESGPVGARNVETFILAQGAAFDLSGDIALNTAHRELTGGENPHSTLPNVTDDAQLKRSANDFTTFTERTSPQAADVILQENSGAGGVKYWLTLATLLSWFRTVFKYITGQYDIRTDLTATNGSTITLNYSLGNSFKVDASAMGVGESFTITVSNMPAGAVYSALSLLIVTGANLPTINWTGQPAAVTDPAIVVSTNNEIYMRSWDNGTEVLATLGQSY